MLPFSIIRAAVLPLALAILPGAAFAQVASYSPPVPLTITFNGQVANNPSGSIMLRTYDPATGYTVEPFTGPVPDFAYHQGDAVTFTLKTAMPSIEELATGVFDAAKQPDGTYRFGLVGPNNTGSTSGVGVVSNFDVSGPINMTLNSGQMLGGRGLSVVIDPANSSYLLATDDGWAFALFDSPGFKYDTVTGELVSANTTCAYTGACAASGDGGFGIGSEDLTSASTGNIPIYGSTGGVRGFFSMLFSGSWNLPTYTAGGGATQVPEPGTLILFGAGAAAVLRRRRKSAPA